MSSAPRTLVAHSRSRDPHREAHARLRLGARARQTDGGLFALGRTPLVAARRERPAEQHEAPDGASDRVAAAAAQERARARELGTHVRETNKERRKVRHRKCSNSLSIS